MSKLFAIVKMDGMANFVRIKLQLLLAKIALIMVVSFTMVTVSVTQIIKGHGVIGNALKVSPVLTAILLYAPIDVRVNRVGLSIIMQTVTLIFRLSKRDWKLEE